MSNVSNLVNLLAQTLGGDMKVVQASVLQNEQKRGDNATLITTHKATIVGALNELKAGFDGIDLSAIINDAAPSATDSTLSAAGVSALVTTSINTIVDGAPAAYDTFKELADYVAADQSVAQAVTEALSKRVRVDAVQNFTAGEQLQGRENIGAASAADLTTLANGVGDYQTADYVATYVAARDAA